jgi:hypothetical protein
MSILFVQGGEGHFDEEQLRYPCCSRDSRCSNLLRAALRLAGADGGTPRVPNYALH